MTLRHAPAGVAQPVVFDDGRLHRYRLGQRTAVASQVHRVPTESLPPAIDQFLDVHRLSEELGLQRPLTAPIPNCAKGTEEARTFRRDGKPRFLNEAHTVRPPKPEVQERILDQFIGFATPAVRTMDLVDGNSDAHARWRAGRGAVRAKPSSDHLDLEIGCAGPSPRCPVRHANGDRDGASVGSTEALHQRFGLAIAPKPPELPEINPGASSERNCDISHIRERGRVLAIVTDVREQERRVVDFTASCEDEQCSGLNAAPVRHRSQRAGRPLATPGHRIC